MNRSEYAYRKRGGLSSLGMKEPERKPYITKSLGDKGEIKSEHTDNIFELKSILVKDVKPQINIGDLREKPGLKERTPLESFNFKPPTAPTRIFPAIGKSGEITWAGEVSREVLAERAELDEAYVALDIAQATVRSQAAELARDKVAGIDYPDPETAEMYGAETATFEVTSPLDALGRKLIQISTRHIEAIDTYLTESKY